jgi:hypothetical protein
MRFAACGPRLCVTVLPGAVPWPLLVIFNEEVRGPVDGFEHDLQMTLSWCLFLPRDFFDNSFAAGPSDSEILHFEQWSRLPATFSTVSVNMRLVVWFATSRLIPQDQTSHGLGHRIELTQLAVCKRRAQEHVIVITQSS